MECAPIGCGGAVVTRLKGVFTGGFFLSATHVERAGPERDREREREREKPDRRTVNYSLSAKPRYFVCSFSLLHFFFYFFFCEKTTRTSSSSSSSSSRFLKEHYSEKHASLFFSPLLFFFLWQWTPLVRATKRAAKQRQSNGNRPVEILSDNSICSRCLVFVFFVFFFLPSVRPPGVLKTNQPELAEGFEPLERGGRPRAIVCPHFTCTFPRDCCSSPPLLHLHLLHLFTCLRSCASTR